MVRLLTGIALIIGAASCDDCERGTGGPSGSTCCKTCMTSKPCGDSCIPRSSTCNVGGGCACSGFAPNELME